LIRVWIQLPGVFAGTRWTAGEPAAADDRVSGRTNRHIGHGGWRNDGWCRPGGHHGGW